MAVNNFEKHLKDTLEKRQIKPDVKSWGQLSAALDKEEKKPTKKYIWYVGIAASIIGVLFLMNSFQSTPVFDNSISPQVVNTPSESDVEDDTFSEEINIISEEETEIVASKTEIVLPKSMLKTASPSAEESDPSGFKTNLAVITEKEKLPKDVLTVSEASNEISVAVLERNLKGTNTETDTRQLSLNMEVEALLKEAKQKLVLEASQTDNTYSKNANNLLQDVEMDLEKSFRDKVFETLKTNFTIVKTAVADRNN
ncbi:hypothetical protein ACW5R3_12705 [Bizionia sp. KMM 8389]